MRNNDPCSYTAAKSLSRIMEKPWRRTIDNINALATNHAKFTTKVAHELAASLTQYNQAPEAGNMGMLERSITQISKDMANAEAKLLKSEQSKSKKKSTKQIEAVEDVRKARARWESEAPNYFEKLQQVDENRIAFLRDALVRYETSAIDLHTSHIKLSEAAIASLLDVNASDEIMHFLSKTPQQGTSASTAGQIRPVTAMSRTASQGDSGSIRSTGGASSSLKSKFGTLLKGRSNGSPAGKRQSILPNFLGSNTARQTLPQTIESAEPEPEYAQTELNSSNMSSNNVGDARAPQDSIVAAPRSEVYHEPQVVGVLPPDADSERLSRYNNGASNVLNNSEDQTSNLQSSLRGVTIRSGSINTSSIDEDNAAIDRVSSTLRAQPTISRKARGRRDVRSTYYENGNAGDKPTGEVVRDILGSPLARENDSEMRIGHQTSGGSQSLVSRGLMIDRQDTMSAFSNDGAESIRSSRSHSLGNVSYKHPDPSTGGLHMSVLETVNVSLGTDGSASDLKVSGEVALANLQPLDDAPLRLQVMSPEAIDKIVANSHVLRIVGNNTYELGAASAPSMTVLLKYQLQPETMQRSRFIPIIMSQTWSPEEHQTSVKLIYRLNPAFGASSLTLHDVEVSVSVDGIANSCVAKPSGTFVKRSSKLVWRLNELTLESGQEGTLLARFKTEKLSYPSDVIDLKFRTATSDIIKGSGIGISATKSRNNPFADSPSTENVLVQTSFVLRSGRFSINTKP